MKSLRYSVSFILLFFLVSGNFPNSLSAEGTAQLAPNGNIDINGNATNDIAALHIDNDQFNNFAAYNNPDINSRLNIHIADPNAECIYLGFSFGHLNNTSINPTRQNFEYRILDPNGNVVFGPVPVLAIEGNIANWSEAVTGPEQLNGVGGYEATFVSSGDLSSAGWTGRGDYYIEFRNLSSGDPLLIDYWDITVADCSGANPVEKPGRIWSYNWSIFAINDYGFPNRPFNGAFFVCAPDPVNPDAAFITQIDFNGSGFRPAAFNVAFNSFGTMNTGNIIEDRRSVENMNLAEPEYAIFLNDPVDICQTAQAGDIDIVGISGCDGQNFCIKFISTRSGQIDLLLDFDGDDNVFTPGTADVMITGFVDASEVREELCLDWDGRDGLGNPVFTDAGSEVPITLSFAQGIYHFPIYDAELLTEGFVIRAVRPSGNDPILFYDDSNISVSSGTGDPQVQLAGCTLPCRRWSNYTDPGTVGFGNLNTINSWWFSQQTLSESTFLLPAFYTCEIEGPEFICTGDTVTLEAVTEFSPANSFPLEISAEEWYLNGQLIETDTSVVEISEAGSYEFILEWISLTGDTCSTSCLYSIEERIPSSSTIDTTINFGDTLTVNSIDYTQQGTYIQTVTASNGCDSTITIIISLLDPIYTCEIVGESPICFGDTTSLEVITMLMPVDALAPPIESIEWSGPGLPANTSGTTVDAFRDGTYIAVVNWLNSQGMNQFTECSFELDLNPRFAVNIDTIVTEGDTLDINGELFAEPGSFEQVFTSQNGCDSIVIINIVSQESVVFYDFEDCRSTDYTNFQPEYPTSLICGDFLAGFVFRNNPQQNAHSCAPGINGGVAMCISSLDDCTYQAGDDKSLIFEVQVYPEPDSSIQITSLNFFERAPEQYQWIVGTEGINNYPLLYGLRVLKNNVEIYRQEDIATTNDWTREIFSFAGDEAFNIAEPSLLRFELLPYCLSGQDSNVSAWDVDQLSVQANCSLPSGGQTEISGRLETINGESFPGAIVQLYDSMDDELVAEYVSDNGGNYSFNNMLNTKQYQIKADYDQNPMNGVSTMDIIEIQRHILGLDELDSAYEFIAADVDNSSSITALDLLHIKKLILGIYEKFPQSPSWRFIDARQELSEANAFIYSEKLDIINPDVYMPKQNFVAVKTGDVNEDFQIQNSKSNSRSSDVLFELNTEDMLLEVGQNYTVSLQPTNKLSAMGLQLALAFSGIEILNIQLEDETNEWQIMHHIKGQEARFIMHALESSEELPAIHLILRAQEEQLLSEALSIPDNSFTSEIYTEDGIQTLSLIFDQRSELLMDENLMDVVVHPNPFIEQSFISFDLKEESNMEIRFYELSGRLIYKKLLGGQKGYNKVRLDGHELGETGAVIICEVRTETEVEIQKILRIQ